MNKLQTLDRCRDVVRLRHLAVATEDCYLGWIARYLDWLLVHGRDLPTSEERMAAFLTGLAHRDVSAATQNQAFNAILFLYKRVLKQELKGVQALRAKRQPHLRTSLSLEQVRALLRAVRDVHGYPCRLVVALLYGCGLRVSEPLNLRIKDLDFAHSRLLIRGGKGGKDRTVHLPCALMPVLERQLRAAKVVWEGDVAAGLPVEVPGQLARKYPRAPFAWQWAWLFPSKTSCLHPRTGARVRYRMHEANVQRSVKAAAVKLGLDGLATPHVLRHCYATHVLDAGGNVRDLQAALGHAHLDTTMGYVHAEADRVVSPLEGLVL